jgi:hypothetical protein
MKVLIISRNKKNASQKWGALKNNKESVQKFAK